MPNTYGFPSNASLTKIAQDKIPVLTMDDPIFQHFPITSENVDTVIWEQKDNFTGLQAVRGINGAFSAVNMVGANRYSIIPGYYGEHTDVDELKLTRLRPIGTFGNTIDASQLVLEGQELLLNREIDRMRFVAWSLCYGRFSSLAVGGAVLHTDVFPIQTYDSATTITAAPSDWTNPANGTPLKDMRNLPIYARGHGVRFDKSATMYVNLTTANDLLNNNNQADLRGKYVGNLGSVMDIGTYNKIMLDADLPQMVVYDEGYLDSTGTFQLFIPNGDAIILGKRKDSNPIGGIIRTRNASNEGGAPGPYDAAVESPEPPKSIRVYRGVNFAPKIQYPASIIRMKIDGSAFAALA